MPKWQRLLAEVKRRYPRSREIHAVKILKKPRGRRIAADLIEQSLHLGCLPVFCIAYKRYCIAGRLVETLFDPMHNERASWLPTGANLSRQDLAAFFCELDDSYLKGFESIYRHPEKQTFSRYIRDLSAHLYRKGELHLAWTVAGNLKQLDELLEAEGYEWIDGKRYASISMNLPVFIDFMSSVDGFLERLGAQQITVLHDTTSEFREAFEKFYKMARRAGGKVIPYQLEDGRYPRIGIETFSSFSTGDSKTHLELQGADILATAVRMICDRRAKDLQLDEHLMRISDALLPMFFIDEFPHSILAAPKNTQLLFRPTINSLESRSNAMR